MKKTLMVGILGATALLGACSIELNSQTINSELFSLEHEGLQEEGADTIAETLEFENIGDGTLYILDEEQEPLLKITKDSTSEDISKYKELYNEYVVPAIDVFETEEGTLYNGYADPDDSYYLTLSQITAYNATEDNREEEGFVAYFDEGTREFVSIKFYRTNNYTYHFHKE